MIAATVPSVTLERLVDAVEQLGAQEGKLLLAAFITAGVTFVLVLVTGWYASLTRRMVVHTEQAAEHAEKTSEQAQKSVDVSRDAVEVSQRMVDQMRKTLELQVLSYSRQSAQALQNALTVLSRRLDNGDEPMSDPSILGDWQASVATHQGSLLDEVLATDVARFTSLCETGVNSWLEIWNERKVREFLEELEDEAFDLEARLKWAAKRLRGSLGLHMRNEPLEENSLPNDPYGFWQLRQDEFRDVFGAGVPDSQHS